MTQQNKNVCTNLFLTALLCGSVLFSAFANAAETDSLKNRRDAINAELKAAKQILALKGNQASTLAGQIQSLEAQANKLQLEIDINEQKLGNLEENIALLSSRIAEKEVIVGGQKQMLSELIRLYYSDYSNTPATLIFSSNETLSFLNQENWTTQLSGKVSELLDSVKTLRESLVNERVVVEDKKKEADAVHMKLTDQDSYLEGVKSSRQSLLVKTTAEQQKYSSLVKSLQEEQQEIEDEINNLQSGEVGSLSDADMPKAKRGLLAYPIKKISITQGYGMTAYAKKGAYGGGPHNGVDFSVSSGTPIYAPLDGKVVGVGSMYKSGRWYGYGRWIAIDHGNGMVTLYGHLSSQSVKKGDKVKTGEKIGSSGNTGYSTGPHLHFTVFSAKSYKVVPSSKVSGVNIPYGAYVNPMKYLP